MVTLILVMTTIPEKMVVPEQKKFPILCSFIRQLLAKGYKSILLLLLLRKAAINWVT